MLPRLIGGMAFALCAMAASAQISPASATDIRLLPMQFELRHEGPASVCGDHCRTWVSAIGTIARETPGDFEAFARDHDLRGATLAIDSGGGSVLGALALGRAVRRLEMTTTVGQTVGLPAVGAEDARATLSPRADCESMCAFLLLAGTRRLVPPEARVFVHEIWLGDRREDATASSYSAEDIVIVQRDIGRLAQYTVEMGGSIDLLGTALQIPPWEPMRRLSQNELRRMGLDMLADVPDGGSQAMATAPVTPTKIVRAAATTERGWSIVEKAGLTTMTRRHPLTVDGNEIGSFDLIFACTNSADAYDVTYLERRGDTDARPAPEPLKQVAISIGRKSTQLEIVTSTMQSKNPELNTVARGVVPAALVKTLAAEGSHSLTVATATTGDAKTVIRMGNTGVAQNFPRFAASCGEQVASRPDTHAEVVHAKAENGGSVHLPK
jgi:hypothetical protein